MVSIAEILSARPEQYEMVEVFDRGRARWPAITLAFSAWAAQLEKRPLAPESLARHPEDVFLAIACCLRDQSALEVFDREYLRPSLPTLRRFGSSPDFAEDVAQIVRTKLFLGLTPRIAAYAGSGPLLAWVRIILTRIAIDQVRTNHGGPLATDIAEQILSDGATPETHLLKASSGQAVRAAVESVLKALSAQDRTMLRLHFLDGLSIDRIAPIFRIHRASAARRIAHLRRDLLAALQQALPGAQNGSSELRSMWRLVGSDIQISLERLLKDSLNGSDHGNRDKSQPT